MTTALRRVILLGFPERFRDPHGEGPIMASSSPSPTLFARLAAGVDGVESE
jgi:hypothetical protein